MYVCVCIRIYDCIYIYAHIYDYIYVCNIFHSSNFKPFPLFSSHQPWLLPSTFPGHISYNFTKEEKPSDDDFLFFLYHTQKLTCLYAQLVLFSPYLLRKISPAMAGSCVPRLLRKLAQSMTCSFCNSHLLPLNNLFSSWTCSNLPPAWRVLCDCTFLPDRHPFLLPSNQTSPKNWLWPHLPFIHPHMAVQFPSDFSKQRPSLFANKINRFFSIIILRT